MAEHGFDSMSKFLSHWLKIYLTEPNAMESFNFNKFQARDASTMLSCYAENEYYAKLKARSDKKFLSIKKECELFSYWLLLKFRAQPVKKHARSTKTEKTLDHVR